MSKKTLKVNLMLDNSEYVGKVVSKRTVYYVFQTDKDYLIFSFRDSTYRSGNFSVVMADTIDRIYTTFKGQKRITTSEIKSHPQMKKFIADFDALKVLYVLVAKKQASIDKRSLSQKMLYFNFKK